MAHYSSVPDGENNKLSMLFSEETNLKPEILYPLYEFNLTLKPLYILTNFEY